MKNRMLVLHFLCLALTMAACGKYSVKRSRKPLVSLLIQNSGFEDEGSWAISAPPNYSQYGLMTIAEDGCHSGKKCGLISLERMPGQRDEQIIHAWTQEIQNVPTGKIVIFGGWVAAVENTIVHMAIEYEVTTPINGQVIFTKYVNWHAQGTDFHFLSGRMQFPENVVSAYFMAGISSVGEAKFDNLFVFVDPQKRQQEIFTTK
ncbi:MAG: hypothetical protein DWQ05_04550 [Calditrichaeota bacterium]|nr:MAG: hypothetical protein DWQ05_04550 [Calditrichota bacterium]